MQSTRKGIEEYRGPLFAYKEEEGRKNIFNPLLPLASCKYKRNLLQLNEKIYIYSSRGIHPRGRFLPEEEYFDSTLKANGLRACVYICVCVCVCVCKYHALFYHPPPRPDKERKNSSSVFTFIQVNIHVCSLYVIRSLDI